MHTPSHHPIARHALPVCPVLILLISLASLISVGCSVTPKTWDQLTTRQQPVPVQAQRLAARQAQGLPAEKPLVWNASTDQYDWKKGYKKGDYARIGQGYNLLMRNPDFPRTYIKEIHVSLTSPEHMVYIVWTGPQADQAPAGPWHSSPGHGSENYNCDKIADSNTLNSNCTPKGVFRVKGFSDRLQLTPGCHYATWVIHKPRLIALHSSGDIPERPSSGGCIRLPYEAAKLIHNNSIAGVTLVAIDGIWNEHGVQKNKRVPR